ncbi:MAG: LysM peptidoglycan-binding domain-containing protein [Syntrophomonadaceae bacterium]|nr:LysM peptidoglycan-binding domain-containing protein [Syntrophomonadaceae bacterium]
MLNDRDENQTNIGTGNDPCPVCNIDPSFIKCNQVSAEQLCVAGMEHYDDGELLKALQYYMTALSLKPDFIPALLGTTCVLVAMERYAEAQTYLDYVFELDPDIKDAKLLRNIINNARSGFPVPEETVEDEVSAALEEDIFVSEPSLLKKYQPYIVIAIVLVVCYVLSGPFLWGKKAETKTPDIADIRSSLGAEPALLKSDVKAEMKGEKIILSGQVASQAERRLAVVIAENAGQPLKVDASQLKVGAVAESKKTASAGSVSQNQAQTKPVSKTEPKAESKPVSNPQSSQQTSKKDYYTVKPGDILSQIARNKYGDGKYWTKIQAANPDLLKDPGDLEPGMVLLLPD